MEKEYVNGEKAQMAQIWISVPKRHDKVIFCAVVAGVMCSSGHFDGIPGDWGPLFDAKKNHHCKLNFLF